MGENRRIAPGLVSPEPLSRLPLGDAFGADVGFVNDFGMKDSQEDGYKTRNRSALSFCPKAMPPAGGLAAASFPRFSPLIPVLCVPS